MRVMKNLTTEKFKGFPKLIDFGQDKTNYYLIMQLLGPSLKFLFKKARSNKFSLKTVAMIGLQLLERIKSLHRIGMAYRDFKPANIMIGRGDDSDTIYLIDFGLSTKCLNDSPYSTQNQNIESKFFIGTIVYSSLNSQLGSRGAYKLDDLESLMYVLIYLAYGHLPWKGTHRNDHKQYDRILKEKMMIEPKELCNNLP